MADSLRVRLAARIAWAFLTLAGLGLVLHITVRDSVGGLSFFYYALPIPIVGALVLLAGLLWSAGRKRLRPLLCLVVAAGLLGVWLADNYRWPSDETGESDLRVLFWNVARGRGGWERISEELRSADADLIGLVEAAYHYPDPVSYWRRQFPEHAVFVAGSGLVLISKTAITGGVLHELGERSRVATAELNLGGQRVRLVLVDLVANPFIDRSRLIEKVEEIAWLFPETPTVILGDFNTPRGSHGFDRLRGSYINTFEVAGSGFLPTWPAVLPILSLDHVWVSPHFVPTAAAKKSSLTSDHSRLWCDLAWRRGLLHPGVGGRPAPVNRMPPPPGPVSPPLQPVLG